MKQLLCAAAGLTLLMGCAGPASSTAQVSLYEQQFASAPPTIDWLEHEEQRLSELVKHSPTPENKAALEYIESQLSSRRYNLFIGEQKLRDTQREPTLVWGNMGRGGAAYRMPANVHALGKKTHRGFTPTVAYRLDQPTVQTFAVQAPTAANAGQGYSHYEMSRWERYCNNGKGGVCQQ